MCAGYKLSVASTFGLSGPPLVRLLDSLFDKGILACHVTVNVVEKLPGELLFDAGVFLSFLRMGNQVVPKIEITGHFGVTDCVGVNVMGSVQITTLDKVVVVKS